MKRVGWELRTIVVVVVVVVVLGEYSCVLGHDVDGVIENKTPLNLHLTQSSSNHGKMTQLPAVLLAPFSFTTFRGTSGTVIAGNQLSYTFGYTPEEVWCETIQPPLQLTGEFKYVAGANTCDSDFQPCAASNDNLTLTYSSCSGLVGTSSPTFVIELQQPPPPPVPTPPPTPLSYAQDVPVSQSINCGIGGTQTTFLASTYPLSAAVGQSFTVQIGGDNNNPASADGSAIKNQQWLFQLPFGTNVVSGPVVHNVGNQGQILSGGGTLDPVTVSVDDNVVTMTAAGKCSDGSVFVPPGFNITLSGSTAGEYNITMNGDPAYSTKAGIITISCKTKTPVNSVTSTECF